MMNCEKLQSVINNLESEINNYDNTILEIFPLRNYINLIDKYPEHAGLQYCSSEVERYCVDIIESSNLQILELYHKLLMVTLISTFRKRVKNCLMKCSSITLKILIELFARLKRTPIFRVIICIQTIIFAWTSQHAV